jgi:glycosyltransferase involved in cell wall biosynthesis
MVCPSGTLYRDGNVCIDCTGRLPLPALRHGCYRDSRLATVPLTVNLVVNRRRWWSNVARFFCTSNAQRQILVQAGMPAQRLAVKHNFVVDSGIRRTGPGKHVLYLGRLSEEKGLRLLMTAWGRIVADGGLGMPLVLAGAGPLQEEVRQWARDRNDVEFLGLRSQTECRELMARSAAVVAPSAWMEPFGLAVVEAMAAAVPAVAASHGAFIELVQEGVTGMLHRPGNAASLADCLRRILADVNRNMQLGNAARRCYEAGFTPDVGLAALVAGYETAIASPGFCESL